MNLSDIVPWGRSFSEYKSMFALSDTDLRKSILGCGDGPASFNAEATVMDKNMHVVSVDPIYAYSGVEIAARIQATFETVVSQARQNAHRYVWDRFPDVDALGNARRAAMRLFLQDYENGKNAGHYVAGALPDLPFEDGAFDLALCSHLLFLYSDQLSLQFHLSALRELLRVAIEVRIFPLLTLAVERSPHLDPVCETLHGEGYAVEERKVAYEFQRGGNTMLTVRRSL